MKIEEELFGIKKHTQAINSKLKGNRNELNLTKVLQKWTGHEFARVPRSGGLRWKNRADVCGDVINVEDTVFDFPFSVETKHVKSLGIALNYPNVFRLNSVVFRYFRQCQRDADAVGKIPVLIVRSNGMKANTYYVVLNLQTHQLNGLPVRHTIGGMCWEDKYCIFAYDSESFFERVDYETFKSIMK